MKARIKTGEITLEMLLACITPENTHHEISSGDAVGNESWHLIPDLKEEQQVLFVELYDNRK